MDDNQRGLDMHPPTSLRRVARNTFVLITLRVVMPAVSLLLIFALSRTLGVEQLGRYSLAFSFLSLFNTIAPLGLSAIITREGARDSTVLQRMLPNAMALGFAASLLMTILMAAGGGWFGYDSLTQRSMAILSLAIIPYTVGAFYEGAFIALQRMEYVAASMVAEYGLKVGGGLLLLYLGYGLEAVLIMAVAGRVISCVASAILLHRMGESLLWKVDVATCKQLAKLAPTFLLITIFAVLYWRVDIFMLSKLQTMQEVGYYAAAYRIFDLVNVIPYSLCLSLYPHMTSLLSSNPAALESLGRTTARYLLAIGLPIATCTMLIGSDLLALLYGEDFRRAGPTLSVLMWTFLIYGFIRYNAYLLVASNRQNTDLLMNVVMLGVNVLLNFVLIPRYSHFGAACATLVSICIYGIVQYLYIVRYAPRYTLRPIVEPKVMAATAACALAVWLVHGHVLVVIMLGAAVYGVVLFLCGFFTNVELRALRLNVLADALRGDGRPK